MDTLILAHICGASGSGKTTLGNKIKDKYPFILVTDLDDLFKDIPTYFPLEYLEFKKNNTDTQIFNFYYKYFNKAYKLFLNQNKGKILIFVGYNGVSFEKKDKFTDNVMYIDIDAKNKYYIKKDEDIILKQRFKRHLQNYLNNIDHFYNRTLNEKPLKIDLNVWKKK